MSRPYLKINALTYSTVTQVLSLNYTYFKLRSATPATRTLTLSGFSASVTFTTTHDSVDYSSGKTNESLTFSVPSFGTDTTTTYTAAKSNYSFGGTLSANNTNVSFTLNGLTVGSVTASSTDIPTFLNSVVNSLVFSAANLGYSVTAPTNNSLAFVGPVGNVTNGVTVSMVVVNSASAGASFTYSAGLSTFAGGLNNYNIQLNYTGVGGKGTYIYSV